MTFDAVWARAGTRVIAVAPDPITTFSRYDWVQVEGVISFQRNERGKWIPVVTLKSNNDIDVASQPRGHGIDLVDVHVSGESAYDSIFNPRSGKGVGYPGCYFTSFASSASRYFLSSHFAPNITPSICRV